MNWNVVFSRFRKMDYFSIEFNQKENRVVITGCEKCKECCGIFYQPLPLLPDQNKNNFFQYKGEAIISEHDGCKSFSKETGCLLKPEERPVICNIYPFILVGRRIKAHYICPAVANTTLVDLQTVGIKVAEYLVRLPESFLYQISEEPPIVENMIDLNMKIMPEVCKTTYLSDVEENKISFYFDSGDEYFWR